MLKMKSMVVLFVALAIIVVTAVAQATWKIDATTPLVRVSPDLFGIFFEEINHAGVGGLHNEQINNGNFETLTDDYAPWAALPVPQGINILLSLSQDEPLNAYNPTSFKIRSTSPGAASKVGAYNTGFWGINLIGQTTFDFSFYVQSQTIQYVNVSLMSNNLQTVYATTSVPVSNMWKKVSSVLKLNQAVNDDAAVFVVTFMTSQTVDEVYFDVFSLLPQSGWNGLPFIRPDLGKMVADMSPSFVRFPGGCYVEGDRMSNRFNWKRSLGPIENRQGHWDLWGYFSEDRLGIYEYFAFVEKLTDVYSNPTRVIWVTNVGVAHDDSIPTMDIGQYIQDTLDSVEFAIGATSTKYGSIRAQMGHPAPFRLDYLAIGNEDCGKPYYLTNYQAMYTALNAVYPNITYIANCDLTGQAPTELYDYHVYQSSTWFQQNQHTFDGAKRTGAKIFNSEYAVTSDYGTSGNVNAALGEAAWMTGLERNSDIVTAASYAPLFVNWNDRHWMPDAIAFNSSQVFGTVSYYNQVLFGNSFKSAKSGTVQTLTNSLAGVDSFSVSAVRGESQTSGNDVYILKMVNYGNSAVSLQLDITSDGTVNQQGLLTTIAPPSGSPNDENSFETPYFVTPQQTTIVAGSSFTVNVPAYSINVLELTTTSIAEF